MRREEKQQPIVVEPKLGRNELVKISNGKKPKAEKKKPKHDRKWSLANCPVMKVNTLQHIHIGSGKVATSLGHFYFKRISNRGLLMKYRDW